MKDRNIPDAQLIKGCLEGARDAQFSLYTRYAGRMFGVCLRYAPDRDTAEDILQEGFIKVFVNLGTYRGMGSFEGWIRRIMVNTALSHYQKQHRTVTDADKDLVAAWSLPDEDEDIDPQEDISPDQLLECIQRLPDGYRIVMNLFVMESYSHKDIAEALGISENTSKSQLHKARAALRRMLSEHKKPSLS